MRGTNDDRNAGLANLQPPQPMHDLHLANRELLARLIGKLFEFLCSHRFVALVVQIQGSPSARVIANHALKDYSRAILRLLQGPRKLVRTYPLAG